MMAVFGEKSGNKDRISEEPSLAAWTATTSPATTPANKKAIPPTKKAWLVRMSRLQKIGEVARKGFSNLAHCKESTGTLRRPRRVLISHKGDKQM